MDKVITIFFMVVQSSIMHQPVLSGLKIKSLLVLVKLLLSKLALKSDFGIQFAQISNTFTVTMVSLLLMSFMQMVLRNINLRVFQELVLIIRMPMLSMPFR